MVVDSGAAPGGRPGTGIIAIGSRSGFVFALADEGHRGFDFDRQGTVTGLAAGGKSTGPGGGVQHLTGDALFARLAEHVEHDAAGTRRVADDARLALPTV